ncbi:MAG: GNAT family N-acetyltransferase [Flavobacteriaceae bacterium]
MVDYIIKTKRLGLRNWNASDLRPFTEMCQDDEVMKYFPNLISKKDVENFIERMQIHFKEFGFCYFAVNILESNEFIGFTGMLHQNYESSFTPCVDIGWRLKRSAWNRGFATEAANACLTFASNQLKMKEIYSFASKVNVNSIAVMKKIGMNYHSDFQHPSLLKNEVLKNCVVYNITL